MWIGEHVGIIRGIGVVVAVVWDATVGVVGTAIAAIIGGFQSVTGEGMTFKEMMKAAIIGVVTGITFLESMLVNLPTVFAIMADTASLKMLGLGLDIIHLFTVVVPNKFQQFAAIIKNVFRDVVATVATMFQGLIALQIDMFRKVAEFDPTGIANKIADALQTGHQFAGAMIDELEGGKSVIPNNAGERRRTPEEIAMQARIAGNTGKIGQDFASRLAPRLDDLNATFDAAELEAKVEPPVGGLAPLPPPTIDGEGDDSPMPTAVQAAKETLQATQGRLLTRGSGSNPILDETKKQSKVLEKIAKNTEEMKPDPKVDTTEMVLVGSA